MTRTLYRTALSLLLTALAGEVADMAPDHRGPWPIIGCVSLAYSGLVVLGYAIGAAVHTGRTDACRWAHRRHWRPTGRVRVEWADDVPPSQRTAAPDPVVLAADVRAITAYAEPGTGRHAAPLADTLRLPVVQEVAPEPVKPTVPMPPLDLTFDLAEYRVYAHGGLR